MIEPGELRIQVLQEFAEAQALWQDHQMARARLRFAIRLAEQRAGWEETRRFTLATSTEHRERRRASLASFERKRWSETRADPAKRAAHNAKRMAAYYRKKARLERGGKTDG